VAASTFRARYSPGPSHTTLVDATAAPAAVVLPCHYRRLLGCTDEGTFYDRLQGPGP
jgi:hypothetical protein